MKAANNNNNNNKSIDPEGKNSLDNVSQSHIVRNSILAGGMAGITSTVLFHPLDVIRTKIQSVSMSSLAATSTSSFPSRGGTAAASSASSATAAGVLKPCMGPMAVLSHTVKHGGYRSLYTGLGLPLGAQILYKATVFTTNNITRAALAKLKTTNGNTNNKSTTTAEPYNLTLSDTFLCGALSGAVNAFLFVTPIEYVRNQLIEHHTQSANKNNASSSSSKKRPDSSSSVAGRTRDVIYKTVRTHGISGLWRGTAITVVRDSLGCGLFFVMFEIGKDYLAPILTTNNERNSLSVTLGAGSLAGIGFWVGALPFDSGKTLIQTGKANTFSDTVQSSLQQDGVKKTVQRLFRGWQVAFGRGAPAAAVTLGTYEYSFQLLRDI